MLNLNNPASEEGQKLNVPGLTLLPAIVFALPVSTNSMHNAYNRNSV